MLRTGAGTAAVGGPRMLIPSCPPAAAFANMPLAQREAILQYWSTSPIPLLRKVQTLLSAARVICVTQRFGTPWDNRVL